MQSVLVLNAGSSSVKSALFDETLTIRHRISVSEIGQAAELKVGETRPFAITAADHSAALDALFQAYDAKGVHLSDLAAVGHRVVHGGTLFSEPARITDQVRDGIVACVPLAPLHNPHHLSAIDGVAVRAPNVPQVAAFDTSFHATNSDLARRYALPDVPETEDLQRYGFHGLSYAALTRALPDMTGAPLPARLLALHLGNGASLCAIKEGRSVATTMGYSPVSGLTMGTRSGDLDAMAVLALAERCGIEGAGDLLNQRSGLFGLSSLSSDAKKLTEAGTPDADFALEHFAYWAARHAGSMIAAMHGLDAIAFTGGIGENAVDIRERIITLLSWVGDVPVHIVPAEEEKHIAREAFALIA